MNADDWILYYPLDKWGTPDGLFMVSADGIGHREFK